MRAVVVSAIIVAGTIVAAFMYMLTSLPLTSYLVGVLMGTVAVGAARRMK